MALRSFRRMPFLGSGYLGSHPGRLGSRTGVWKLFWLGRLHVQRFWLRFFDNAQPRLRREGTARPGERFLGGGGARWGGGIRSPGIFPGPAMPPRMSYSYPETRPAGGPDLSSGRESEDPLRQARRRVGIVHLGRQVINYERGALWSPTDIFTALDLTGLSPVRLGSDALRASIPIGATGGFDLVAAPGTSPSSGSLLCKALWPHLRR